MGIPEEAILQQININTKRAYSLFIPNDTSVEVSGYIDIPSYWQNKFVRHACF